MNDHEIDRLLKQIEFDGGPRLEDVLRGAGQELLEEIMSGTEDAVILQVSGSTEVRHQQKSGRRVSWALTAAAVVAAVMAITLPMVLLNRDTSGDAATQMNQEAVPQQELAGTGNPRFVPDVPGWKWLYVQEDDAKNGSVRFGRDDGATMRIAWAVSKDGLPDHVGGEPVTLSPEIDQEIRAFGVGAEVSQVGRGDFFRLKVPYAGGLLLFSGKGITGFDAFFEAVSEFRQGSVEEWANGLPTWVVTPAETRAVVEQMLADVPLPPNPDIKSFEGPLARDYAALGEDVIWSVTCAYLTEYEKARQQNDQETMAELAEAMSTSRDWQVLQDVRKVNDSSPALWDLSNRLAAGDDLADLQGLYCSE